MKNWSKDVPLAVLAAGFFGLAPAMVAAGPGVGAVYAATNLAGANSIVVYARASDGTLSSLQTILTGGGGSGIQLNGNDALGSQGSLALDNTNHMLYAVNTETATAATPGALSHDCNQGSISSFSIASDSTLTFVQKISSGGLFPNSLTLSGNLLYVLNAGGGAASGCAGSTPNITGFTVTGGLSQIALSAQPIDPGANPGSFLNCDNSGLPPCGLNPPAFPRSPGQVGFAPGGHQLIVTDKGPNKIYVFPVNSDGTTGAPAVFKATVPTKATKIPTQPTYFGFDFDAAGHLLVSEPFGTTRSIPAVPASSVSSFTIGSNGSLTPISVSVANQQGTSCWVKVVGQYAFISNNATGNISSYTIAPDGHLTLLQSLAATLSGLPNDISVVHDATSNKDYLYVLDSGNGTVDVFRIESLGTLTFVQSASGLPVNMGAQGLAGY